MCNRKDKYIGGVSRLRVPGELKSWEGRYIHILSIPFSTSQRTYVYIMCKKISKVKRLSGVNLLKNNNMIDNTLSKCYDASHETPPPHNYTI
jgi:hypothetical protein